MKWVLIQSKYKFNVGFPLSIAHVATFLIKKTKEKVLCFDSNLKPTKEIIVYLKRKKINADVFGLSCTEITEKSTLRLCATLKREFPKAKIMIGGASAKTNYRKLLENKNVDFCFTKEIEQIGSKRKKFSQQDLFDLPGMAYRESKGIVVNPAKNLEDINWFPFPDRDIDFINIKNYDFKNSLGEYHPVTILTSRGCPYQCTYCASSRTCGKKILQRSPKLVVKELNYLRNLGFNNFVFEDYEMLVNLDRTKEICKNLKKHKSKWVLKTRVEKITPEMASLMADSGCLYVYLGVETITKKAIWGAKKFNITKDSVDNAITNLKKNNIGVCASIQFGLPGDTEKTFIKNTVLFLKKRLDPNRDMVQLHFTTLFPGTELYEKYFDKANYVNVHQQLSDVVAHGLEGNVMPHLNEKVIKRVYKNTHKELGNLLSHKAIWNQIK